MRKYLVAILFCLSLHAADTERPIVQLDGKWVYADTLNKKESRPEPVPDAELKRRELAKCKT